MGFTGGAIYQHGARWFVQLYWHGKTEKFWNVLIQGIWCPIKSYENAEKLLRAIQQEIDADREGFNPRSFRPDNPLVIGEYYLTWLAQIDVKPKTRRDYRNAIVRYALPFFGVDKDIRKLRKAELVSFMKSIPLSECGRNNVMAALKAMVKWAYSNEEIRHVPPFPEIPNPPEKDIEYLTLDQQELVLAHIPCEDAPVFRFAMEYGLRIGEVCALQRDAIKDGKVYIRRAMSDGALVERTKTGVIRSADLTPYAQEIINGLTRISPFLFVRADGQPYKNRDLNKLWREASEKAGIKIKLYNAIRHSLGCQMLDEGHDLSTVQEILGHKDPSMTRRYAKRTAKKIGQILTMRRVKPEKEKEALEK